MKSIKIGFLLIIIGSLCLEAMAQTDNPLPHFMFPGFTKGVTRMKDGKTITSDLNYNMVDEILVTELNGTYRYAKDNSNIDTVYLSNKKLVPYGKIFYEVLVSGPVSLFLQNKSYFAPKGSNVGYGAKSQSVGATEFERMELNPGNNSNQWNVVNIDLPENMEVRPASVYWIRKNGAYEKFANEKQFLKIFPDQQEKLKTFIKQDKINFKKHEDLIRLVKYCNSIIG